MCLIKLVVQAYTILSEDRWELLEGSFTQLKVGDEDSGWSIFWKCFLKEYEENLDLE